MNQRRIKIETTWSPAFVGSNDGVYPQTVRTSARGGAVGDRQRGRTTTVRRGARKRAQVLGFGLVFLLVVLGVALLAAGRGPSTVVPAAGSGSGTIDFTVFSPPTVERVSYLYRGGSLSLGAPAVVARPPGADGIAYTPSGDLVVGGQTTGQVFVIPAGSGQVTTIPTGNDDAFLVTISPSGDDLYTGGLPGALSEVPLHPVSKGHAIPLTGDDRSITALAFGPGGQVLYTASAPGGRGDIGLLDMQTHQTHRLFTDVVGAHGIMFDTFSNSYLAIGGDSVLQLSPSQPNQVLSEFTVPGMQFDQGAVTNHGLAFFASNTGYLVAVDYSATGRIGDLRDVVQTKFLAPNLDDVAPLVGPGARPVTTSAPALRRAGTASFGAAGLLLLVLVASVVHGLPKSKKTRRLPRWDKRRKA